MYNELPLILQLLLMRESEARDDYINFWLLIDQLLSSNWDGFPLQVVEALVRSEGEEYPI